MPVALINILSRILERKTNKRLVWYLKKEKKKENRDRPGNSTRKVLCIVTHFLVAISSILGDLRYGIDGLLMGI